MAFSFISLLVLRAALGVGEAAFVGVPFYLSFFYKRNELAFRTGFVHFGVNPSCFEQRLGLQDTLREQEGLSLLGRVLLYLTLSLKKQC